jgi:hypothetical protein
MHGRLQWRDREPQQEGAQLDDAPDEHPSGGFQIGGVGEVAAADRSMPSSS